MNLLNILMGLVAGISIDAALTHGLVGLSLRPRDGTRIAFAAGALAVASGAVAAIALYSAHSVEAHAAITKWVLFPASAAWTVAVVWLVAYHTGVRPVRWLLALSGGFAVVVAIDFWLPLGLLHDEVGELRSLHVAGSHVVGVAGASPHPLNLITDALTAVAFVFLTYALVKVYRRGERGKAAYLAIAVTLFAVTMIIDSLADHGVVASVYTTQLFFAGVVLVTSFALRRASLRSEMELRVYRTELESLVDARVADLDRANEQLATEVRTRLSAEEDLRRRVAELDALQHLSQTLVDRIAFSVALDRATREIEELFRAQAATVHLAREDAASQLGASMAEAASRTASITASALEDTPLFKEAIERRDVIVVADPAHAELPPDLMERVTADGVRDLVIVPMLARGEVLGVLNIVCGQDSPTFSGSESRVVQTVADTLAAAVANERFHQQDTRDAAVRERQHLARELHDAVTQTIYSATLIADALPEVWEREPDEGLRRLGTLRRLVHGALAEMRTLLFELRPGALRAAPLDTLLERLGAALAGQVQIPVDVHVREDVAVPEDVKIALYRVAQEAFSNIAKHARARQVTALLTADGDGATLTVHDDGRGFDPSSVSPERMGLRIMRERLDQIGASIDVDSAPGRGTTVVAVWPRAGTRGPLQGEEDRRERLDAYSSDDRG